MRSARAGCEARRALRIRRRGFGSARGARRAANVRGISDSRRKRGDGRRETEEPTEKKLKKVREKGQVAKSKDIADAMTLAAAIGVLTACESMLTGGLSRAVRTALDFVRGERTRRRRSPRCTISPRAPR